MAALGPLQRCTLRTRFRRIVLFARADTTLFASHRRSTVPARAEGDAPHRYQLPSDNVSGRSATDLDDLIQCLARHREVLLRHLLPRVRPRAPGAPIE